MAVFEIWYWGDGRFHDWRQRQVTIAWAVARIDGRKHALLALTLMKMRIDELIHVIVRLFDSRARQPKIAELYEAV